MSEPKETIRKNGWGGKRLGAGRKPGPNASHSKVTTVVLTKDLVAKLHRLGGSKWIRRQIQDCPEKTAAQNSQETSGADLTSLEKFFQLKNGESENLSDVMIPNPDETLFFQAADNLMQQSGIEKGDLIIVDRSQIALDSLVVVHNADGYSIRRLVKSIDKYDANPGLYIDQASKWRIVGRIIYVIKQYSL